MSDNDQNQINKTVINDQTAEESTMQIVEEAGQLPSAEEDLKTQSSDQNASSQQSSDTSDEVSSDASTDSDEKNEKGSSDSENFQNVERNNGTSDNGRWYVVHTFSGHENKVATNLKQRIESEHLENKIFDILVPTQDKIEIRSGKKEQVKEKIFPGYILVKMILDDQAWLAVRTTQGVTAFVGMNNRPTPISEREVQSIVKFMTQGAAPTFKDVFLVDDTVKIIDGPFADFIGKVDSVDKEKGKVRVLVSIFGRETPVELDFLQVAKL